MTSESSTPEEASRPTKVAFKRSVSEIASDESSGKLPAPGWLSWFEKPFLIKAPTSGKYLPEVTASAMDAAARGPMNMTRTFIGASILRLALADAGCKNPSTCHVKLHGLKPSSLLTTATAIVGVVAALTMPIVGAVVDHTRYRKIVGATTAFLLVCVVGGEVAINENNWFVMLCLEAIGSYVIIMHITSVFAYLPDLSYYESDYITYTTGFNFRQFGSQLLLASLVVTVGIARPAPNAVVGAVRTGRVSASISLVLVASLLGYAWTFLFRKRPALAVIPPGQNLLTVGFIRLKRTIVKINSNYGALRWFMISLLFSPDANGGVIFSITTTFLTVFLHMTSQQVAIVSLIMLAFNTLGSFVSRRLCRLINPLNAYRFALCAFIFVTAISATILTGPERKNWAYGIAAIWGTNLGTMYPSQRVLYCTLIPRKQEMEFMGLFAFCGNILSWLPPLVFTSLNERGVSMQWGLAVIPFFLSCSLFWTLVIGNYDVAVSQVAGEGQVGIDAENGAVDSQAVEVEAAVQSTTSPDANSISEGDAGNV